jgi:hypothetical protein
MTRKCAVWISPWCQRDMTYIVDTAAICDDGRRLLQGPDTPPEDTVLVVMHPSLHAQIVKALLADPFASLLPFASILAADVNGGAIARCIIHERCVHDPELKRRLKW